ncbi:MAG: hypothetical protein GY733_17445, partial [bacterium]|nr:hypothetical protein [bacterium]
MSKPSASSEPAGKRDPTPGIALALAVASFTLHLVLAVHLSAVGAVDQFDVFFHADTQARLDCVVAGECDHRSSISHPALDLFVNPPVRT